MSNGASGSTKACRPQAWWLSILPRMTGESCMRMAAGSDVSSPLARWRRPSASKPQHYPQKVGAVFDDLSKSNPAPGKTVPCTRTSWSRSTLSMPRLPSLRSRPLMMAAQSNGSIRLVNVLPLTPVMLAEYVPPDFEVQQRKAAEDALAILAKEIG